LKLFGETKEGINIMKKFIYIFIAVLFSGISYSQSGWYQVYEPAANKYINTIQFTSGNTGYAALWSYSNTGGLLKTTNAGVNWEIVTPPGAAWDLSFLDDNTGYIDFYNGMDRTCKTSNGGINWVQQDSLYDLYGLRFFDVNTGFVAAKYGGGKRTTNGGNNWTYFPSSGCWHQIVSICCLTAESYVVGGSGFSKTTNSGTNWINTPVVDDGAIYFFNATTGIWASYSGRIYKTTNAGNNWFTFDSINTSSLDYRNIMFVNENTGYLSAHYNYIYKTTNGGHNWSQQVINSSNGIEYVYFINPNTGYAGGYNGAIYKTTTGGTVFVNKISTEIPSAYSLSQNYPNPFNPSTVVRFSLSVVSNVVLKVYDVNGREVEVLVNERLQPGTYQTDWNGSKYSSGVYFYKIQAGDFSETKRMLLIK